MKRFVSLFAAVCVAAALLAGSGTSMSVRELVSGAKGIYGEDGERFFGLGEAGRDRVQLRGGAFFIRKGAIIPKWRDRDYVGQYTDEKIELHFYPYGESKYIFREDDGISLDYLTKTSCHTRICCSAADDKIKISIGERVGSYDGKPQKRIWKVTVHGTTLPVEVSCAEKDAEVILCGE